MISRYNEAIDVVASGRDGSGKGLPFTVDKLTKTLGGITPNTQYLILGKSKTGKSRFAYDSFIFNQIDQLYLDMKSGKKSIFNLTVFLFTFEIAPVNITLLAMCRYLYLYTDKHTLTFPKQIAGRFGKCDTELYELLYSDEMREYVNFFYSKVKTYSVAYPNWIDGIVRKYCISLSKQISLDELGRPIYKFNSLENKVHVVVDHLSLVTVPQGMKLKQALDATSAYLFVLKNEFPISTVLLQQINPQDRKDDREMVLPDHENARDTKNTFQDCDVCIALGAPFHLERMTFKYKNQFYNIIPDESNGYRGLKDRFRIIGIQKDRDGEANKRCPAGYVGEVGMFTDIQDPDYVGNNGDLYAIWDTVQRTYPTI